ACIQAREDWKAALAKHLLWYFLLHRDGVHRDLHSFPTRRSSDLGVPFHAILRLGHRPAKQNEMAEPPGRQRNRDGKGDAAIRARSEEHTSELQSLAYLVCRLLLEKKKSIATRTVESSGAAWTLSP